MNQQQSNSFEEDDVGAHITAQELGANAPTVITGCQSNDDIESLHRIAIRSSFVIRWVTCPLSTMMGAEEQTLFDLMLVSRRRLIMRGGYPRAYMVCVWDVSVLAELLWRFSLAHLEQLFLLLVKSREK